MITLVGVGHVFAISENVKQQVRSRRPDAVCLELDPARFDALIHRHQGRSVPLQYRLLAYFQKRIAGKFGTEVGAEMVAGAEAAQEMGARLFLIDMDAAAVFQRLWSRMSFRERVKLFTGAFAGLFVTRDRVEKEIQNYEAHEEDYLKVLGEGFPTLKEVLIDDRNRYMADHLKSLAREYRNIVAIVGDGHIKGLLDSLAMPDVDVVRLKDLLKGPVKAPPGAPPAAQFSQSFWYDNRQ